MPNYEFPKSVVADCCRRYGPLIKMDGVVGLNGEPLDSVRLMWAFALKESFHRPDGCLSCPPRFEKSYYIEGSYCQQPYQMSLIHQWGKAGACSYGCWQVMLCNAPGFVPQEFTDCEKGALAFLGHINGMIKSQKPQNITQVADAYNSGNFRDWVIPDAYIKLIVEYYYHADKWPMPAAAAA